MKYGPTERHLYGSSGTNPVEILSVDGIRQRKRWGEYKTTVQTGGSVHGGVGLPRDYAQDRVVPKGKGGLDLWMERDDGDYRNPDLTTLSIRFPSFSLPLPLFEYVIKLNCVERVGDLTSSTGFLGVKKVEK